MGGDGWLPWCREPSRDAAILQHQAWDGRNFAASAVGHARALRARLAPTGSSAAAGGRRLGALQQLAVEELLQAGAARFVGAEATPLFLCACFCPAPTRELLRGVSAGERAPLDLDRCIRAWDRHDNTKKAAGS